MIRAAVRYVLLAIAALLVVISFVPLIETNVWWVRTVDFVRLQLLLALVIIAALLLVTSARRAVLATTLGAIAVAAAYHVSILWHYTPLGEGLRADRCEPADRLKVMVANVLLGNRQANELVRMVQEQDPDVFLAMETDDWWAQALAPLDDEMPYSIKYLTGSYYGIILFSRLALDTPEIVFLADQDTPTIKTGVRLRTGEVIDFIGLHPRPPHPTQPSTGRDAQLLRAAFVVRDGERPAVIAGDLNATPWETAVARMQRIGRLVDPREGYAYVPTFSADSWWMSWPLDHVFHERGFATMSLQRLGAFGSDHYPYVAELCRTPQASGEHAHEPEEEDFTEARRAIEAAIEMSRSDR